MTTHDRIVSYEKEKNIHEMLSISCVIQSGGERLVIDSERENNNLWIDRYLTERPAIYIYALSDSKMKFISKPESSIIFQYNYKE